MRVATVRLNFSFSDETCSIFVGRRKILLTLHENNKKGNVPYYYDPYIPTDNDPNIKYDNLNPNYYNNPIPVVSPIKKNKG